MASESTIVTFGLLWPCDLVIFKWPATTFSGHLSQRLDIYIYLGNFTSQAPLLELVISNCLSKTTRSWNDWRPTSAPMLSLCFFCSGPASSFALRLSPKVGSASKGVPVLQVRVAEQELSWGPAWFLGKPLSESVSAPSSLASSLSSTCCFSFSSSVSSATSLTSPSCSMPLSSEHEEMYSCTSE